MLLLLTSTFENKLQKNIKLAKHVQILSKLIYKNRLHRVRVKKQKNIKKKTLTVANNKTILKYTSMSLKTKKYANTNLSKIRNDEFKSK